MKISEAVDGFVSEDEADDYVAEEDVDFFDEEDDDDGNGGSKALTKKLEELKAAALVKFDALRINFDKMRKAFEKDGYQSPVVQPRPAGDQLRADDDPLHRQDDREAVRASCARRSTTCAATSASCARSWSTSAACRRNTSSRTSRPTS